MNGDALETILRLGSRFLPIDSSIIILVSSVAKWPSIFNLFLLRISSIPLNIRPKSILYTGTEHNLVKMSSISFLKFTFYS